ncbi:MAG: hypothetical protein ABMA13_13900 [Chthoniobacteraceae bacterium]
MARREDRKAELIDELAAARRRAERSGAAVRESLDVPARVRRAVSGNLFVWIGGAALLGVVLAKMPGRTRKVYVDGDGRRVKSSVAKTGLLLATAKIAFDVARPLLFKIALERLQPFIERVMRQHDEPE